jgi:Ca2+-binding RTX toxin-like protein
MPRATITLKTGGTSILIAGIVFILGLSLSTASATVEPGTPAKDVHIGLDDDNADNSFIQPPGVAATLHMDDTDVLFGRDNDDLLIGRLGDDTLLGGDGSDILIGGPDQGHPAGNDVLVGDVGNDVSIWSPGDGNDAVVGNEGNDTLLVGQISVKADGTPALRHSHGRRIPGVRIDDIASLTCTIAPFPSTPGQGFEYLIRIALNGLPTATVREKEIERVICPGSREGTVEVAVPHGRHPAFRTQALSTIGGVVGHIVHASR